MIGILVCLYMSCGGVVMYSGCIVDTYLRVGVVLLVGGLIVWNGVVSNRYLV